MTDQDEDEIEAIRRHNREVAAKNLARTMSDPETISLMLIEIQNLRDEVDRLTERVDELEEDIIKQHRPREEW